MSVAGGGDLGIEIRLEAVYMDIEAEVKRYEPESHPALYLRFEEEGATILAFRTGKYNIAGASSIEELYETHQQFVGAIEDLLDVDLSDIDTECELRNMVYVDDYGDSINYDKLIPVLGQENIQYQPEEFTSLDYRPPEEKGLFKIFASGKISLTGTTEPEKVDRMFRELTEKIDESKELSS